MKEKYFRNQSLLDYKPKASDSFLWKSLCSPLEVFKSGVEQEISSGEIIWKYSSSGIYSVKSGYDLAWKWKQAKESTKGETSNTEVQEKFWSKLWRFGVPDRVKITVWRIFHNG